MPTKFQMAVIILAALAAAFLQGSDAKAVHVVGWTIPPPGSAGYASWAASNTFTVGDSLVFNFANGMHNAAEVTKADYDSCNSGNPISIQTDSPANFTLDSAGQRYFICTFGAHCNIGQKLAINVLSAPNRSPSPTLTPTPAPRRAGPAPRMPPQAAAPSPNKATPPPSSTSSAPSPSTGAAPSPSKTSPPPSYISTPPTASAPPTPSTHLGIVLAVGFMQLFV